MAFQGILLSPSTPSCLNYDLILHSVTATCKEEKFSTFSEKQKTKIHSFLKTFVQFLKIAISMKTLLLSTDSKLIYEFRNGNNQSLETLIYRYKDKIFSSILFLVKDKYLAEDLFQDTFIKIIDTIRDCSYNEEGKFLSYAIRIAHNICVDNFRKVKRTQAAETDDDNFSEIYNFSDDAADKNIIQLQTSERVRQLLEMLPEDQREVIVLRHFADLSFKEIAKVTNCNISTALGRMRYALINMRRIIADKQVAL